MSTKKSKIKFAVKKAMLGYYKSGMTNTAHNVYRLICESIDKAYKPKKQIRDKYTSS